MSAIAFSSFYLECDAQGCDASFVDNAAEDLRGVRRSASENGWVSGEGDSDVDYCWRHEELIHDAAKAARAAMEGA